MNTILGRFQSNQKCLLKTEIVSFIPDLIIKNNSKNY
jgi:hypothetical protein